MRKKPFELYCLTYILTHIVSSCKNKEMLNPYSFLNSFYHLLPLLVNTILPIHLPSGYFLPHYYLSRGQHVCLHRNTPQAIFPPITILDHFTMTVDTRIRLSLG